MNQHQDDGKALEKLQVDILNSYGKYDQEELDGLYNSALAALNRKIIVLDDDPTGVQTVHDIYVYTTWDKEAVIAGFADPSPLFFILTNSRGLTSEQTRQLHQQIGRTIAEVAESTGQDYILISRSDSTLRGHFPLETGTLRSAISSCCGVSFDGEIIVPFFAEGGRFTINDIHYVKEGNKLVPAALTEFAKDKSFGYSNSDLKNYIQEKTGGSFPADEVVSISLKELRALDLKSITDKLMSVSDFNKIVVNAISYDDIKVFTAALAAALARGKRFMFRSAAAVPKILGAVTDAPLLDRDSLIDPAAKAGGIVLIGSHVNKTSQQLEALRSSSSPLEFIEFNQHLVMVENGLENEVLRVVELVERDITAGISAIVYTKRERFDLDTSDKDKQLEISVQISDAVTSVIGRLKVKPGFIIAKGGITSSDVGTKALQVRKALVMGQIKPGIPVWMTGPESKFPQMPYVIFPGNVGEVETLREIVESLI